MRWECIDPGPLVPSLVVEGASRLQSFMACSGNWISKVVLWMPTGLHTSRWSRQHVRLFTSCSATLACGAGYYHFLIRRRRKATLRCAEFNPQLHVVRILNSCARSRIWVCSTVLQNCGDWEWPSVSDLWTQRDGDEVWASRTDFNCSIKRLPPRTPGLCCTVTTRSPSSRLHHRDLAVPRVVGSRIRRRTRAGVVMC